MTISLSAALNPLKEAALLQEGRLFLWSPVVFAVGIGLYFALGHEPNVILSFGAVILFCGVWGWLWSVKNNNIQSHLGWIVAGSLCLVFAGLFVAQIRSMLVYTPMLEKRISAADVSGVIDSLELLEDGQSSRIVLRDPVVEDVSPEDTPRKVRLLVRKDDGLAVGQRVSMLAGLNPPSPPVAPGAFDFQRYAYFKGIGAVGFSYEQPEILEEARPAFSMKPVQIAMIQRVEEVLDYPQAAFAMTLMTGQKGAITDDDKQAMRDAGLAHLLAISGMHVGMVAAVIFFTVRLLLASIPRAALYLPIKKIAAVVALLGIVFYTFLAGASVPTQRALLMTGLVLIAVMADRSPLSLRIVAIAAFAVLLIAPESLMSVSFQMSFAAVVVLIAFYDAVRDKWGQLYARPGFAKRIGLYMLGILLTTIIAEIAIAPFAIFHFQHRAMFSLISNLAAVPLMAFLIMPALVMSAVLMPFGLAFLTLPIAGWGIELMIRVAHWTAGLDGAVIHAPAFSQNALIVLVLGGVCLALLAGRMRLLSVPFFAAGMVMALLSPAPDILVSGKADVVAVRNARGDLVVSTRKTDRYSSDSWLRLNGQEEGNPDIWPKEGGKDGFPLLCDAGGCRGEVNGYKVAVSYQPAVWQEDCNWADLVIASVPVDGACAAAHVVDRFSVWREGAHSVYLADGPVIKTVAGARGERLWTGAAHR